MALAAAASTVNATKTAAMKGDIGFLKGSTSCVSGEEVRILIDEEDFGIGASTQEEKSSGVSQQFNRSRLRWSHRDATETYQCGKEVDVFNLNYSAMNCLPEQGFQGIQRYPAFPSHNSAVDTEFKFCKDNVSYLYPAPHHYAVAAFYRNDNEDRCGCPFPAHMFSIDFQADKNSYSQVWGGAGPTLVSADPTDFVRVFFCFRETEGYYVWNQWEWESRLGKVGVFSSGHGHIEPFNHARDQGPASAYQMVWELHPNDPSGDPQVNTSYKFNFHDCLGEGYWTEAKQAQVKGNLFNAIETFKGGPILDLMVHATWRGPN